MSVQANGTTLPPHKLLQELSGRRIIGIFLAAVFAWTVVAGFVMSGIVEKRVAAYLASEQVDISQRLSTASRQFELALNRLRGVPVVVAGGSDVSGILEKFGPDVAPLKPSSRLQGQNWFARPELQALSSQFKKTAAALEVDVVWAMNAAGDCVAASNFDTATSFIGVNYADRKYFRLPQAGERGYQYAMGRVTNVPGLFFSYPVRSEKGFLGVVTIKIDLPRLAPWVSRPDEFVTDDNGVVILAGDANREMLALNSAEVQKMPVAQLDARYKRTQFQRLDITSFGGSHGSALVRVAGSEVPHFFRTSEPTPEGLRLHILAPAHDIERIRRDGLTMFALLVLAGVSVASLMVGGHIYVRRIRQHQQSMQATNEKLSQLIQELEQLSRTDPLTGCVNRRHFRDCLNTELDRARRYGRPCSLIILDIDWFKKINDSYGHAAGDEALKAVVRKIGGTVRRQDIVARLGGEEFVVLMPETGMDSALASAERIRRAIAAEPACFGGIDIPLTVSAGVAVMSSGEEPDTADSLLHRADQCLYQAKTAGRNCVMPALT
jgi:diguanylate cyclase